MNLRPFKTSEAVCDHQSRLEAIVIAKAIAQLEARAQREMGAVFLCSKLVSGSYLIALSTADQ